MHSGREGEGRGGRGGEGRGGEGRGGEGRGRDKRALIKSVTTEAVTLVLELQCNSDYSGGFSYISMVSIDEPLTSNRKTCSEA